MASWKPDRLAGAMTIAAGVSGYPHWEKVPHLPMPEGLDPSMVWALIKIGRQQQCRDLPLRQADGSPFWYTLPDELLSRLEAVNTDAGGALATPEAVATPATRGRYIIRALVEEATDRNREALLAVREQTGVTPVDGSGRNRA